MKQECSQYAKLLAYILAVSRLPEYLRKGGIRVDTLVGRSLCAYCYGKMQNGEMPRTSLINHMDTGKTPREISQLNQFERLFIKLASHFAVYINFKLATTLRKRKSDEKMKAIKGFAVNIPVPIQDNVNKIGDGRPGKLIDPQKYLILHSNPTKSKIVWKSLIDVNKVFTAL